MTATTVSFTNFLVMLGGICMQPLVGFILEQFQTIGLDGEVIVSAANFSTALLVMPIGLVLSSILCIFLRESYTLKAS